MAFNPIRPACVAAFPLPLRATQTWPSAPVLGQLLPAQLRLQDAGGREGSAVLWRGRSLAIYDVFGPDQRQYLVWVDSRGSISRVQELPV